MSTTPASIAVLPVGMAAPADANPKKTAHAAQQFEALMIAQILRTAHESASDSLYDSGDSSEDTMFDVAGQQFAQVIADNGGFGLARTILQGLQPK